MNERYHSIAINIRADTADDLAAQDIRSKVVSDIHDYLAAYRVAAPSLEVKVDVGAGSDIKAVIEVPVTDVKRSDMEAALQNAWMLVWDHDSEHKPTRGEIDQAINAIVSAAKSIGISLEAEGGRESVRLKWGD